MAKKKKRRIQLALPVVTRPRKRAKRETNKVFTFQDADHDKFELRVEFNGEGGYCITVFQKLEGETVRLAGICCCCDQCIKCPDGKVVGCTAQGNVTCV